MHALVVTEQGTTVSSEGDLLVLSRAGQPFRRVRAAEIDQLLLMGRVELSSGAVALAARRGIDVAWLTLAGRFRARLLHRRSKNVPLRVAQYRYTVDECQALGLARAVVAAKVRHQREVLLRAQRRLQDAELALALG